MVEVQTQDAHGNTSIHAYPDGVEIEATPGWLNVYSAGHGLLAAIAAGRVVKAELSVKA